MEEGISINCIWGIGGEINAYGFIFIRRDFTEAHQASLSSAVCGRTERGGRAGCFSDLTQRKSVRELSEERGWNEDNTRYFLDALYCLGFIWKRDEMYCNCRETDRYLVKGRPEYIGGHLAFHCAEECIGCRDIKRLVEEGPGGAANRRVSRPLSSMCRTCGIPKWASARLRYRKW